MTRSSLSKSRQVTQQHGPAIRALRRKEGYEIAEFANLVGISYSHLQNIEHENKPASIEHLNKIARLLGVPLAAVSRDIEWKTAQTEDPAA